MQRSLLSRDRNEREYNDFQIGPTKSEKEGRERVSKYVALVLESNESQDTKHFNLMKMYDQLSYTFELNEGRKRVAKKYQEIEEEYGGCIKCVTSPCTTIAYIMKKSFWFAIYLCSFISFMYLSIMLAKKVLIG